MASGKQPSAGAAAEPMIVIDGLTKHFGPFTAVDGIGFSVAKGEVLGFLGPDVESVSMRETGAWVRLSLRRGHVLVRRSGMNPRGPQAGGLLG